MLTVVGNDVGVPPLGTQSHPPPVTGMHKPGVIVAVDAMEQVVLISSSVFWQNGQVPIGAPQILIGGLYDTIVQPPPGQEAVALIGGELAPDFPHPAEVTA